MGVQTIWHQATTPASSGSFTGTLGTAFTLSQAAPLTGIWYYSPAGAGALSTACAIYDVTSTTVVAGTLNSSPSWSGAAGSGWVKCSYGGTVTLNASQAYVVAAYFNTTVSSSGSFTWPVLSGVIDATSDQFLASGSFVYPSTNGGAFSHFIDVEVTVPDPPPVMYQMRFMG